MSCVKYLTISEFHISGNKDQGCRQLVNIGEAQAEIGEAKLAVAAAGARSLRCREWRSARDKRVWARLFSTASSLDLEDATREVEDEGGLTAALAVIASWIGD